MNESSANTNGNTMKTVYTVVERGPGKSYWTRVGVGFVNRDGSINLKLDAVPVNGTLQVRDWEPAERFNGGGSGGERPRRDVPAAGPPRAQAAPASPATLDGAPF